MLKRVTRLTFLMVFIAPLLNSVLSVSDSVAPGAVNVNHGQQKHLSKRDLVKECQKLLVSKPFKSSQENSEKKTMCAEFPNGLECCAKEVYTLVTKCRNEAMTNNNFTENGDRCRAYHGSELICCEVPSFEEEVFEEMPAQSSNGTAEIDAEIVSGSDCVAAAITKPFHRDHAKSVERNSQCIKFEDGTDSCCSTEIDELLEKCEYLAQNFADFERLKSGCIKYNGPNRICCQIFQKSEVDTALDGLFTATTAAQNPSSDCSDLMIGEAYQIDDKNCLKFSNLPACCSEKARLHIKQCEELKPKDKNVVVDGCAELYNGTDTIRCCFDEYKGEFSSSVKKITSPGNAVDKKEKKLTEEEKKCISLTYANKFYLRLFKDDALTCVSFLDEKMDACCAPKMEGRIMYCRTLLFSDKPFTLDSNGCKIFGEKNRDFPCCEVIEETVKKGREELKQLDEKEIALKNCLELAIDTVYTVTTETDLYGLKHKCMVFEQFNNMKCCQPQIETILAECKRLDHSQEYDYEIFEDGCRHYFDQSLFCCEKRSPSEKYSTKKIQEEDSDDSNDEECKQHIQTYPFKVTELSQSGTRCVAFEKPEIKACCSKRISSQISQCRDLQKEDKKAVRNANECLEYTIESQKLTCCEIPDHTNESYI